MADYSSLATLPLVPGRVFYAPQVLMKDKRAPQEQLQTLSLLEVLLARSSGGKNGDLELLAILLKSPYSETHLVTQVSSSFTQSGKFLRIPLFHQASPPYRKLYAKMQVSQPMQLHTKGCLRSTMMRMLFCILQASLADAQIHEFPHHLRDDLRKNWILTFPKKGLGSPIHPIPQPYFDCAVQFNWRGWG